jgi:predicted DNA-binding transcriptional regulator AlpA
MSSKSSTFSDHTLDRDGSSSPDDADDLLTRRAIAPPPVRLIFKRELLQRIGLSFPTIWKMMKQGRFPRARIIGGKSAWIESEVDDFIAALPLRQYKDDQP